MEVDQVIDSYLLKMPVLVIENILSHITNLSNVSLTCKFLYKIVCDTERFRRVMYIRGTHDKITSVDGAILIIDDDAMFYSVMNSMRTIKQIKLCGDPADVKCLQLNERQFFRLTAIMKLFGANITSLELDGFKFAINTIIELLQQTPRLESLRLANGSVMWTDMKETPLQLSNLNSLEFSKFMGCFHLGNLATAGSLTYFRSIGSQSSKMIQNILKKQHNIKSLILDCYFDEKILCVNHLQLETLILEPDVRYNSSILVQILKCHRHLKELKIPYARLSVTCFEWICNNLKKLEVLEIHTVKLPSNNDTNVLAILAELKKLRYFRTSSTKYFIGNGFPCDSLEKLKIVNSISFGCGGRLNRVINSIVQSFANLTELEIKLDDFAALSFVLSQCTTLTSLSSIIDDPVPHQFTQQRFPSIQHLTLTTQSRSSGISYGLSQSITAVAYAVPNLKSLSMPSCSLIFNVSLMEDFIKGSKSLRYFSVECFELERDFSADNFFEVIRRLSDQLKGFQLTFKSHELLNSDEINQILSNEFIDQHGVVHADGSSRFCLHKRDGHMQTFCNY